MVPGAGAAPGGLEVWGDDNSLGELMVSLKSLREEVNRSFVPDVMMLLENWIVDIN